MRLTILTCLIVLLFGAESQLDRVRVRNEFYQDTISSLRLRNKIYPGNNYKVLLIKDIETDLTFFNSRGKIILTNNGRIVASIVLPIPDEDAKNFSVTNITETKNGFKVAVNWGGGNYIYDIDYYFIYSKKQFYFSELRSHMYGPNAKVDNVTKIIRPLVPINKFEMISYLDNH